MWVDLHTPKGTDRRPVAVNLDWVSYIEDVVGLREIHFAAGNQTQVSVVETIDEIWG